MSDDFDPEEAGVAFIAVIVMAVVEAISVIGLLTAQNNEITEEMTALAFLGIALAFIIYFIGVHILYIKELFGKRERAY